MKFSIFGFALVLAAALQPASFSGSPSPPRGRPVKGADSIPFESVARGTSLNSELATREGLDAPSLVVARNRAEAQCLIGLLNPSAAKQVAAERVGGIDFQREWVVAVIRGRMGSGGFGISVEEIKRTPEGINVRVKLIDPDPRVFQQANMPHPFHIIRVPRGEVNSAPPGEWFVRTLRGKPLTQTSRTVSCPPSNNGMHPTADTKIVIYFQRLGAAGDARR